MEMRLSNFNQPKFMKSDVSVSLITNKCYFRLVDTQFI